MSVLGARVEGHRQPDEEDGMLRAVAQLLVAT